MIVSQTLYASKWDTRFLNLAAHTAQWSKDPSTKVGAVIVDKNQRVVSLGYNGFPRGVEDSPERLDDRATKYKLVVHAEENAILFAQRDLSGHTMYLSPLPPCSSCTGKVIQSGITRVVSAVPPEGIPERWMEDIQLAGRLCKEAKVVRELYMPSTTLNPDQWVAYSRIFLSDGEST